MRIILICLLFSCALTRTYPLYKQCDAKWGPQQLGSSSNSICKSGSATASLSMALAGIGKDYNPSTLNTWLKANNGYQNGDTIVWGAVSSLGLSYVGMLTSNSGKIPNSKIKSSLDAGNVVICNVRTSSWVLATAVTDSTVSVNDPAFSNTSYNLSEIVDGMNNLYLVNGPSHITVYTE